MNFNLQFIKSSVIDKFDEYAEKICNNVDNSLKELNKRTSSSNSFNLITIKEVNSSPNTTRIKEMLSEDNVTINDIKFKKKNLILISDDPKYQDKNIFYFYLPCRKFHTNYKLLSDKDTKLEIDKNREEFETFNKVNNFIICESIQELKAKILKKIGLNMKKYAVSLFSDKFEKITTNSELFMYERDTIYFKFKERLDSASANVSALGISYMMNSLVSNSNKNTINQDKMRTIHINSEGITNNDKKQIKIIPLSRKKNIQILKHNLLAQELGEEIFLTGNKGGLKSLNVSKTARSIFLQDNKSNFSNSGVNSVIMDSSRYKDLEDHQMKSLFPFEKKACIPPSFKFRITNSTSVKKKNPQNTFRQTFSNTKGVNTVTKRENEKIPLILRDSNKIPIFIHKRIKSQNHNNNTIQTHFKDYSTINSSRTKLEKQNIKIFHNYLSNLEEFISQKLFNFLTQSIITEYKVSIADSGYSYYLKFQNFNKEECLKRFMFYCYLSTNILSNKEFKYFLLTNSFNFFHDSNCNYEKDKTIFEDEDTMIILSELENNLETVKESHQDFFRFLKLKKNLTINLIFFKNFIFCPKIYEKKNMIVDLILKALSIGDKMVYENYLEYLYYFKFNQKLLFTEKFIFLQKVVNSIIISTHFTLEHIVEFQSTFNIDMRIFEIIKHYKISEVCSKLSKSKLNKILQIYDNLVNYINL